MIKQQLHNKLLYIIYGLCFFYLIFQNPIYTPDTSSYIRASIWRSAGYPSFLFIFKFIFGSLFNITVIGFQLISSLLAIHLFSKKITELLSFPLVLKYVVIGVLLFPLFPPLSVANNICSEGLSYPLYLFALYFSLHFIFQNRYFLLLLLCTILLILTRGQFTIVPFIIIIAYGFNYRKTLFHRSRRYKIILLIVSIILTSLLDKSFHKITRDLFITTPFTYINTTAAALYVSNTEDANSIKNEDYKTIFKDCHAFIKENDWILSLEKRKHFKAHYLHFHNNLGKICNYTFHNRTTRYYENKGYTYDEARAKSEEVAKNIFPVLVKNNFNNYIKLYYTSVSYGFKSTYIFWLVIFLYLITIYKLFKTKKRVYCIIFFLYSLVLSNALIVSFASHAIMRYLFYNYSLLLIASFQLIKSILSDKKT